MKGNFNYIQIMKKYIINLSNKKFRILNNINIKIKYSFIF